MLIFRQYPDQDFDNERGWPFCDAQAEAFIPKVPMDFPDFPRKIKAQEDWREKVRPCEQQNYKWENLTDGGVKFTLELAGKSKENTSVEIKSKKWLVISFKKNPVAQIGLTYDIPSPGKLDLESAKLTMEHGLLTIFFAAKKTSEELDIKLL